MIILIASSFPTYTTNDSKYVVSHMYHAYPYLHCEPEKKHTKMFFDIQSTTVGTLTDAVGCPYVASVIA